MRALDSVTCVGGLVHNRYDLTKRNCNHFTNTLAGLLGVGIARVLTNARTSTHTARARILRFDSMYCASVAQLSLGELVAEYTL